MAEKTLRILVADDHDIVRRGIRAVLESQSGWQVCGLAANGREAVSRAIELKPDVVILDMTMPELNGLDAAIQIKQQLPDTEILVFSAHESEDLIRRAFEAGVKSFIVKSDAHHFLVDAVKALGLHKPFFTARVSQILFSNIVNRTEANGAEDTASGPNLSPREREIVQLLAGGKSNKEVAEVLAISVRTAESHRANVLRKLNLDSVAGLVRYAIRNHLVEP